MNRGKEYIGFRGKFCDIVTIGQDWFDYRNGEPDLPKKGAYCKKCRQESAKPIFPIYMNGREAYALRCTKCGSEYPMYKSVYTMWYLGSKLSHGYIRPTHGLIGYREAMDGKARNYHDKEIPKKIEQDMCKLMDMTVEEYREQKKQWDEEQAKSHKEFLNKQKERMVEIEEEEIQRKSEERKMLIEKGVLKYVKGVGLVNTETNQIVKL